MEEGEDEGRMQRREAECCARLQDLLTAGVQGVREGTVRAISYMDGGPQEVFITVTLVEKEQEVVH